MSLSKSYYIVRNDLKRQNLTNIILKHVFPKHVLMYVTGDIEFPIMFSVSGISNLSASKFSQPQQFDN